MDLHAIYKLAAGETEMVHCSARTCRKITTHSNAVTSAKDALGRAEQQLRAERERQAVLSRELEEAKSTTTTTSTNAQQKLKGEGPVVGVAVPLPIDRMVPVGTL